MSKDDRPDFTGPELNSKGETTSGHEPAEKAGKGTLPEPKDVIPPHHLSGPIDEPSRSVDPDLKTGIKIDNSHNAWSAEDFLTSPLRREKRLGDLSCAPLTDVAPSTNELARSSPPPSAFPTTLSVMFDPSLHSPGGTVQFPLSAGVLLDNTTGQIALKTCLRLPWSPGVGIGFTLADISLSNGGLSSKPYSGSIEVKAEGFLGFGLVPKASIGGALQGDTSLPAISELRSKDPDFSMVTTTAIELQPLQVEGGVIIGLGAAVGIDASVCGSVNVSELFGTR